MELSVGASNAVGLAAMLLSVGAEDLGGGQATRDELVLLAEVAERVSWVEMGMSREVDAGLLGS